MKHYVILAVSKMVGEAVLLAIIVGIAIGIIGNLKKWDSMIQYSNAFFIAGCLVIIAGLSSRLGASQERSYFQLIHAESFREMSASEQANFIIEFSSSVRLVILGLMGGILLILISALLTRLF